MKNTLHSIFIFVVLFLGCSKDDVKSKADFNKNYTVKIVDTSSKEEMQKTLNDLYNNIQAIQYGIKKSIIDVNQKQSKFEYELKKVATESQAIGVDWKEKCRLIQDKQREEIIADQLMIKFQQDMLNEETKKYKDLHSKYYNILGDKQTNDSERVYPGDFRNSDSNEKHPIHKTPLSDSIKEPKSTR